MSLFISVINNELLSIQDINVSKMSAALQKFLHTYRSAVVVSNSLRSISGLSQGWKQISSCSALSSKSTKKAIEDDGPNLKHFLTQNRTDAVGVSLDVVDDAVTDHPYIESKQFDGHGRKGVVEKATFIILPVEIDTF